MHWHVGNIHASTCTKNKKILTHPTCTLNLLVCCSEEKQDKKVNFNHILCVTSWYIQFKCIHV